MLSDYFADLRTSATAIADKLGIEFALIHRQKDGRTDKERMDLLVGDVRGKVNYRIAFSVLLLTRDAAP